MIFLGEASTMDTEKMQQSCRKRPKDTLNDAKTERCADEDQRQIDASAHKLQFLYRPVHQRQSDQEIETLFFYVMEAVIVQIRVLLCIIVACAEHHYKAKGAQKQNQEKDGKIHTALFWLVVSCFERLHPFHVFFPLHRAHSVVGPMISSDLPYALLRGHMPEVTGGMPGQCL